MGTKAVQIAVGAVLVWAGARASLAQPPAAPAQTAPGPLEPPRFREAPVSADAVQKVKKSMSDDPFDTEAPVGGATAAKPVTAPAGGSATDGGAAPAVPTPAPAAPTTTPGGGPTTTPTPTGGASGPRVPPAGVTPAEPPRAPPPAPTGTPPAETKPLRPDAPSTGARLAPTAPSQHEDVRPTPEPAVASRAPEVRHDDGPGFALQAGGGIMAFGSAQMQSLARSGGYWDVRLVLGLRRVFAFELAYLGTMNPLLPPAVESRGSLVGNGAEGNLRVNIPFTNRDGAYVLPYGIVGMGWQHYRIVGDDSSGAVMARRDDVLSVPVGGGLTIGYRHLYLDSRFTYRFTQYEDLLSANGPTRNELRHWGFGGNFGYVF